MVYSSHMVHDCIPYTQVTAQMAFIRYLVPEQDIGEVSACIVCL